MTYKAAVIGLGQIGMASDLKLDPKQHVYSHARAFNEHPLFELVAGVDTDPQRRDQFDRHFGRAVFAGIDEAMRSTPLDVVAIAVPTDVHVHVLRKVLLHCRPRVLLCEKPLAYDLDEAREILRLCDQSDTALYVNYIRRVDPAVRTIKRRLDKGDIVRPVKGIVWYSKGLFNNGSHLFDLLQYWLGDMQSFQIIRSERSWGDDPEPDLLIVFSGVPVYFLAAREEDFSHYTIELLSPNGRLRYDRGGQNVVWQSVTASATFADYTVLDGTEQKLATSLSRIQWHVVDHLAEVLNEMPSGLCSGEEALRVVDALASIAKEI